MTLPLISRASGTRSSCAEEYRLTHAKRRLTAASAFLRAGRFAAAGPKNHSRRGFDSLPLHILGYGTVRNRHVARLKNARKRDGATKMQSFNWRAHLDVHPIADAFPLLEEKELKELAADIERNGLQTEIVVWSPKANAKRKLLDGRNRLDALAMLGALEFDGGCFWIKKQNDKVDLLEERCIVGGDPEKHAYSLNVHRRHLTPDQKRDLIARLLKAEPEKSNWQIAKAVDVSHPHVAKICSALERSGDVETVTTSIDTKGRKQPAKKPTKPVRAAPQKSDPRIIAPEVAERIGRVASRLVKLDVELARELASVILELGAPQRLRTDITTIIDFEEMKASDAEAWAERRKAELAALDDGRDPGPLPESLWRRS